MIQPSYKAYKFRIYPNAKQTTAICRTFGGVRFVWNNYVETFYKNREQTKIASERYVTIKEYRAEFSWLRCISSAALNEKVRDFEQYKSQFFNKKRKVGIGTPRFRHSRGKQSFRLSPRRFAIFQDKIRLEKIGWVRLVLDRELPRDAKQLYTVVSRNSAGEYYVSITVEETIQPKPKTNKQVGVDLGLKYFCVTSDGEFNKFPPQIRENQAKISKLQKIQSRKVGSKRGERKSRRWLKLQRRINRLYQKIVNQRAFFLHNLSARLVTQYDVICIEDLNVAGMMKNHCLAGAIARVAWSEFVKQLEYKCAWYGKTCIKVGRFEPTSKICSCCGWKNNELTLKDRVFECQKCGGVIDRDYNAALNIKALGIDNAIRTQRDKDTNCVSEFQRSV
jgi:putative transposase